MKDKFYSANTKQSFNYYVEMLKSQNYEWVGKTDITFDECKQYMHKNAKLVLHAFYNDITKKKEIQFGTKSIYHSYHKNIKIENDLTEIRKNAKKAFLRDGYNRVIIEDNDGLYSFQRKYDGVCPSWYGKIIEII